MQDAAAPLPLTILSGYLGAGKTTLVNHLLRNANGRRLVVLVNDFGELPIDADLIESRDGDTLNLANGCACCSMGGDLFNALVDVLDRTPRPDHLLIEASGVADPARIANIALAEPDLKLDAIISLVDAETFEALIEDPLVGETVMQQIKTSDIILLNKLDLIEKPYRERLTALLKHMAPGGQVIETEFSKIPLDMAIGMNAPNGSRDEVLLPVGGHGAAYVKWSRATDRQLNREQFEQQLALLGKELLRLKGIVYFTDSKLAHSVQCVGARRTIAPMQNQPQSDRGKSRLVAIGLKDRLDRDQLDQWFDSSE